MLNHHLMFLYIPQVVVIDLQQIHLCLIVSLSLEGLVRQYE